MRVLRTGATDDFFLSVIGGRADSGLRDTRASGGQSLDLRVLRTGATDDFFLSVIGGRADSGLRDKSLDLRVLRTGATDDLDNLKIAL